MANVCDYVKWRGDLELKNDEFNEIDGLILSRLYYFPFEQLTEDNEEITIEELDEVIKEIKQEVVKNIKESAKPVEPVENNQNIDMINFCKEVLKRNRNVVNSDEDYRRALNVYFNITEEDIKEHSPEALLRRECKRYLLKEIENLK